METKPIMILDAKPVVTKKVVAKVVSAGKEYKAADTLITAMKASTVALKAGELLFIIGPSSSGKPTYFLY